MRKVLLSFILALTAITGIAQTVGDAIYFYRNDGGFNAFFRADIDSITFSTIEGDSTNIDGIMVQTIHTPDSAYEIPLSVIDSVSFVNPETILQPDVVRMDESMLSYLQAVDGMTLTFNATMPSSLRPKKGNLLLSVVPTNFLLTDGFAGRVTSVSETANAIQVTCTKVDDISDIFVQLIGVERIGDDDLMTQASRRAMNSGNIDKLTVDYDMEYSGEPFENAEMTLKAALNGELHGSYVYFFNLFNQVLDVKIQHQWDYTIDGSFKYEDSFKWPNDKSKYNEKVLKKILFPAIAPVFKLELTGAPYLKTEGSAEMKFNYKSRKYAYITHIKYEDDKGFSGCNTIPAKESVSSDNTPTFNTEFALNGALTVGGKVGLSVGTIDFFGGYLHAKADIGIGPKVEAEFNLKGSTDDEFRNLYTEHKDSKLELGLVADVEIFGEAKFWGKEKEKKTVFENTFKTPFVWERYLLPELDNIYARGTSGNNSTGWCFGRATRPCLFTVNLGFVVADVYNNYVGSFYDPTPYINEQSYFSTDISGLSGGKVTVYPAINLLGHEILATPSTELIKVATMPGENGEGTFTMKGKVYGAKSNKIGFYYNTTSDLESGHATYVAATPTNSNGDFSATITNPAGNTLYFVAAADLPDHLAQIDEHRGEPQIATLVIDNPDEPTPGKMIDLGLSVKWAGWDVGSDSPEVPGDLYAWGETETKSEYTSTNYIHFLNDNLGGNFRTTGLYCNIGNDGDISGTQYDAAHVKWGGGWRMPTKEEAEELLSQCTKKYLTYKGQRGWLLTGPNGNKIFLGVTMQHGIFWTGTWGPQSAHQAWCIYTVSNNSLEVDRFRCSVYQGRHIRAVCD